MKRISMLLMAGTLVAASSFSSFANRLDTNTEGTLASLISTDDYSVYVLNGQSNNQCALMGYAEVEISVHNDIRSRAQGFDVFAVSGGQTFKVASVLFAAGYAKYPVEFFAGKCTERVIIEYTYS